MLSALLTKFWPVFIPLGFYVIWLFIMSRRTGSERARVAEHIRKGLLFWAICATVVLLIGCFIFWGFSQEAQTQGKYVPPTVVNGELVPGHMSDDTTPSGDE